MSLRYFEMKPEAALRPYVRCLWILEGESAPALQTVYPDGCCEWIFHFGDAFSERTGGMMRQQTRTLAAGQLDGPVVLLPGRKPSALGVRFEPGGMAAFVRVPQSEIAGRIVDLREAGVVGCFEYVDRMANAADSVARIGIARQMLVHLRLREADRNVGRIVGAIHESMGLARIDLLAEQAGISRRQMERLFLSQVGIGPKRLARIVRFQNALKMHQGGTPWPQVAVGCGYFDQAHLIADIREFTGGPPGRMPEALLPASSD